MAPCEARGRLQHSRQCLRGRNLAELWPAALEQLGQVFHCSCVSLVNKELKTSAATAFAWGIDAAGERSYLDYWLPRNVFHLRTRVWHLGEVQTDRDILPKHEPDPSRGT